MNRKDRSGVRFNARKESSGSQVDISITPRSRMPPFSSSLARLTLRDISQTVRDDSSCLRRSKVQGKILCKV